MEALTRQERIDIFWKSYDIAQNGCWLWKRACDTNGYGVFTWEGRQQNCHRISVEITTGKEIPAEKVVDHLCGVKRCINPCHLEVTTQLVNMRRWKAIANPQELCGKGLHRIADSHYIMDNGTRRCKPCSNEYHRQRARRLRGIPKSRWKVFP